VCPSSTSESSPPLEQDLDQRLGPKRQVLSRGRVRMGGSRRKAHDLPHLRDPQQERGLQQSWRQSWRQWQLGPIRGRRISANTTPGSSKRGTALHLVEIYPLRR
jgi:hypothetical protein